MYAARPSASPQPTASAIPFPPTGDACPDWFKFGPWEGDQDGLFVPMAGAVSVTDCGQPGPDGEQTLTRRVNEVLGLLNKLPREKQPRGGCYLMGHAWFSYLVRYAEREPVHVLIDENCYQVYADGEVRDLRGIKPFEDGFKGHTANN